MKENNTVIGGLVLSNLSLDALLGRQSLSMDIIKYLEQATKGRHYTQTELDLLTIVSNDFYRCAELVAEKWDEMFTI